MSTTKRSIPGSLFDDLTRYASTLFKQPVCACFLSIDAALPTDVARLHLEFLHHRKLLLRYELRQFCQDNLEWTEQVLPDEKEQELLQESSGELPVYIAADSLPAGKQSAVLRERMKDVCIDLALMLLILEEAVFRDQDRLKWLFQVTVQALREGTPNGIPNPIGALVKDRIESPAKATLEYYEAVAARKPEAGYRFETFRVISTTQLRMLYYFAKALNRREAPGSERFDLRYPSGRRALVAYLAEVLLEGLETEPYLRSPEMLELLGRRSWLPHALVDDQEAQNDDLEKWFAWASAHREFNNEFAAVALSQLDPQRYSEDLIEKLLDRYRVSDPYRRAVYRQRRMAAVELAQILF